VTKLKKTGQGPRTEQGKNVLDIVRSKWPTRAEGRAGRGSSHSFRDGFWRANGRAAGPAAGGGAEFGGWRWGVSRRCCGRRCARSPLMGLARKSSTGRGAFVRAADARYGPGGADALPRGPDPTFVTGRACRARIACIELPGNRLACERASRARPAGGIRTARSNTWSIPSTTGRGVRGLCLSTSPIVRARRATAAR